jgi:hypothetical protein
MSRTFIDQHDRVCSRLMAGAEKDGWLPFDTNTKSPFDRGFIPKGLPWIEGPENEPLYLLKPILIEVKTTSQTRNTIALNGPQLEFREKVKQYQCDYALVVLRVLKGAGKKAREERLFVYTDTEAVRQRIERWWKIGRSEDELYTELAKQALASMSARSESGSQVSAEVKQSPGAITGITRPGGSASRPLAETRAD